MEVLQSKDPKQVRIEALKARISKDVRELASAMGTKETRKFVKEQGLLLECWP